MLEINKEFKKCFQLKNGSKLLLLNEQWLFLREEKIKISKENENEL